MNRRIIVIDDEETILKAFQLILSPPEKELDSLREKAAALESRLFAYSLDVEKVKEDYKVTTALQGEEGYRLVREAKQNGCPFALAFIDIRMPPGWDGLQTAKMIRELDREIEIVIVTAYSDRSQTEIAAEVGSPEKLLYIKKPFDPGEIRQLALSLTEKWDLARKAENHKESLERLLQAVRRLKTLSLSSVRDVLLAILNEVLLFVGARKGFIARVRSGEVSLELASEGLELAEIHPLLKRLGEQLPGGESISRIGENLVLLLKDMSEDLYILATDGALHPTEETFELLRLLLETSSEVLTNVRKQEQYLRSEKIAAIGEIAAGIVHEINNPMTAILNGADLFRMEGEQLWNALEAHKRVLAAHGVSPPIGDELSEIERRLTPERSYAKMLEHHALVCDGVERVRSLMQNVRGLSRGAATFEPSLGDVGKVLASTLKLARSSIGIGIRLNKEWESPLSAWCDTNGLGQVFLNLILNAVQAMKGAGELRITGRREGEKILVAISDSGPGIPEEVKDRIFAPFFTTKSDGTGLGLTIVKRIIDMHNGTVHVESELGRGTCFRIEIPVYPPGISDSTAPG